MTNKITSMFSRLAAPFLKPAFAILAALAVGCAWAAVTYNDGEDWIGGADDTLCSTSANWHNGRVVTSKSPMRFNGQAGKTVTFDALYSLNSYVWIGESGDESSDYNVYINGDTVTPVIFETSDSNGTYGFTTTDNFSMADGKGQTAAITLKSGTYTANNGYWSWWGYTKLLVNICGASVHYTGALYSSWGSTDGHNATTINITNGTLKVDGNIEFVSNSANSTGTINIGDNSSSSYKPAVLECGNSASSTFSLCFGTCTDSSATVNLENCGVLRVYNLVAGTGNAALNFNGGTLQALGIGDTALVGSGISIVVGEKGGSIDTDGHNVSILGNVTGAGALFIKGTGNVDFSAADLTGFTGVIVSEENGGTVTLPAGIDGSRYANSTSTLNCTGVIDFKSGVYAFNNMAVSGASGNVTASGATLKIATTGSQNDPEIGNGTGGSLTISDGTVYLGIATSEKWTKVNGGTINLDGGELQIGSIRYIGGSPVVNFNGGTLYQYGNTWNGNEIIENNGNWNLNVLAGGAKIYVPEKPASNFDGATTTISQELQSGVEAGDTDGGLTKLGPGTLILAVAPTFNGGITLHEGSIVIPDTYPEGNVTTDVSGYQVSVTIGDGVKTFTCTKIPVTWQGDEDSNWNTPGNWDGGVVPTASDDVVIPANSTITLNAAAYAATITADETVTISVTGFGSLAEISTALQNGKWRGTVQFNGTDITSDKYTLESYANSASTIEFVNFKAKRIMSKTSGALKIKVSGSFETTNSYLQKSNGWRDYRIEIASLSGSGSLNLAGSQVNSINDNNTYRQNYFVSEAGMFSGSLYTHDNYFAFSGVSENNSSRPAANIKVCDGYLAGLGLGAIWQPNDSHVSDGVTSMIDIAGTLKVQQGADATATTATLKAPTVTFENGATIQYAKLGTIALVNASNEGIAPSGSGTVNIAFGENVTLADGVQLMSWAADATPNNVTFAFSDASLNDGWKLTASETGLVLNTKNPVASVDGTNYGSLATAMANAADDSSIVLKVNSAEAITLKGTQTLTIDSGVVYTGALTISSPTESETVEPTLVLNAATTVASVTVGAGATFALPSNYALLTGENVLAIGGAGWVKFNGNNSSAYSAATISVPDGTLEFAAGSTFKDIAAGTVYVNGTVTGTTLDAEGNIGNGSTLFTLTNGTFANATVTAYINGTDTAIHYTNTAGEYTAGKVFYWINTSTGQATGDVANNVNNGSAWSTVSSSGAAASEIPFVFDTAIFDKADKRAILNANIPYNIFIKSNFRFLAKDKNNTYTVGSSDAKLVVAEGVSVYFEGGQNTTWGKVIIASNLIGGNTAVLSASADVTSANVSINSDTSKFYGKIILSCAADTIGSFTVSDAFADSEARWSIFANGNKPTNTIFPTTLSTYTFKSLDMSAYVRHTGGSTSNEGASSIGANTSFNIGGNGVNSTVGGTWPTKWTATINWIDSTATFTQSAANTDALNIAGGGYAYIAQYATEGSEANYVPGSIKFLDNGGYLTIDDNNAEIAGDIVNAIAAAGTGETQSVAGFNVTAADEVTAAVTDWSALAASGITKKGDGTLTLTGTPQAYTGTTTVEAGLLVMPASAEETLTLGANTIVSAREGNTITLANATTVNVTGLTHEHATATVTAGEESVTVNEGVAVVPVGSNVVITWTPAAGYQIDAGETQELSDIREAKVANAPTVSELPTVSIAAPEVGAYGNDFATVSVTAGVTSTYPAATTITYTLKANGTAIATTTAAGDATSVTFDNANVSSLTRYDNISYTVEASGDNVTAATSGATTAMLADSEKWVDEKMSTTGMTGSWKTADGAAATVTYDNGTERAELSDNKFSANNCSTGDVVTVTIKDVKYTALSDTSTVDADAQGSIALGGTEDALKFMVLTKSGNEVQWSEAAGVVPSFNTSYTIVFTFAYTNNTYSITVNGTTLTVGGSATYDIVKTTNKYVKDIDFLGAGSIKAIEGIQYDAMMAVDQNGVRYATVADALNANKGVKGAIIKLLHGTSNTSVAGWSYNAETMTFIKKAVGLIFLAL